MSIHNQREVYGDTLVALGKRDERIVVLEADLGRSTMSAKFADVFPRRYFEMGIAEQNMTGFAAGLAISGKIPFTNSFAVFAAGRAYDQIRQSICTANLNVKIVGSSAGLSDFGDGATHQSVEDMAIMSALPNMTVLAPCDGVEAGKAVEAAAAIDGPVYIRIFRNDLSDIYPDQPYCLGEPVLLHPGKDVCIFTIGTMAHEALEAAAQLQEECIVAKVVHIPGLKPLNEEKIREMARGAKAIVTCEEHTEYGGLAMRLAMIFNGSGIPMETVAIRDSFGQSAYSHEELMEEYGLTAKHIAEAAKRALYNKHC